MTGAVLVSRTARAESLRIWTLRSSWVVTGVTSLAVVGFGVLLGLTTEASELSPGSTAWDGGRLGSMFALFGVLALAVVAATADHGSGGIVPTLQWTPRRGVLVTVRAGVVTATGTALGVLACAGAAVAVRLLLPGLDLPWGDGVAVLGGLALLHASGALMATGLGLFLRSTAGALATVVALVLVLPFLLAQLGFDWSLAISERLPGSSALFLVFGEGPGADMTVASSRLTMLAWACGCAALGAWRLLRSDAT